MRDGSFLGQYNQPGNIPSGTLSGQIQPTGSAHLTMDGLTSDPVSWRGPILSKAASDGSSMTGVRRTQATTSITRAVVKRPRPSPCSSRRFATERLGQLRTGDLRGGIEQKTSANHTDPFTWNSEGRFGSRAAVAVRLMLQPVYPQLRKHPCRDGSYAWCQYRT